MLIGFSLSTYFYFAYLLRVELWILVVEEKLLFIGKHIIWFAPRMGETDVKHSFDCASSLGIN